LLAVGLVPLLASSVPGAVAGITVVGVGLPWVLVAFVTLRQRLTPPRLQGRVAAASNLALDLPQSLTIVLGALVIASVDYRLLITGSIAGLLAASTLVATLR